MNSHRRRVPIVSALSLAAVLIAMPSARAGEPNLDPGAGQSMDQVIERYIRTHPEVIEQSLQALETKRQAEEKERVKAMIAARRNELLNDPASPVSGNPNGDVTVVEFFDYRCGFCKRAAGAVSQLQKDDRSVRVVYKDFPILGEASELAAKAALASRAQGKHQAFHEALLAAKGELSKETVLAIARDVGLDVKKLEVDMDNPEWTTLIERNRALAKELGITGTPGFIVGDELHPGALDLDRLKYLVAQARPPKWTP